MKETLFFATFETDRGKHDRYQNFKSEKNLKEFTDWIEDVRAALENEFGNNAHLVSMNIFRHSFDDRL